jgi:hypothetical protein
MMDKNLKDLWYLIVGGIGYIFIILVITIMLEKRLMIWCLLILFGMNFSCAMFCKGLKILDTNEKVSGKCFYYFFITALLPMFFLAFFIKKYIIKDILED